MEKPRFGRERKPKFKYILIIIGIILLILFFMYGYYRKSLGPVSKENRQTIHIEIPSGSSTRKIGDILYNKDLINNQTIFQFQAKIMKEDNNLKAGNYELNQSMNLKTIIHELTKGGTSTDNTLTFTIPEGYELRQIGERLAKDNIVDLDTFTDLVGSKTNFEDEFTFLQEISKDQSLEGYLFPSTYEVYKSADEREIINKMLVRFEEIYNEEIKDKLDELDLDLNEIVTMASLVEREARKEGERALIAGVYYNRLDIDMKLQCDATVQYALGKRKDRLFTSDLKVDSPYNTYLYSGLPIGPISSVGEASIRAALDPEDSDYLYYVARDDGSHIFTETFEEHKKAKKEALNY